MTGDEITLVIHCWNLPGASFGNCTGLRLGVQRGQEVVADVSGDESDVTFTIPLRVIRNPKNGIPNFLGPFVQGSPDDRFIYLSWGTRRGGEWEIVRRAKIMLGAITWDAVGKAIERGHPIEASVDMTDGKGEPRCATVKGPAIVWDHY